MISFAFKFIRQYAWLFGDECIYIFIEKQWVWLRKADAEPTAHGIETMILLDSSKLIVNSIDEGQGGSGPPYFHRERNKGDDEP